MKIMILFFLFLIIACSSSSDSSNRDDFFPEAGSEDISSDLPDSFYAPDYFNRRFADADKIGIDDSEICWAASAANALTWSGWAVDENAAFDILRDEFPNRGQYLFDALDYYFRNHVSGDASVNRYAVRKDNSFDLMDFIKSALINEKAVIAVIKNEFTENNHSISVYGFEKIDDWTYLIFYADSDDGIYQLKSIPFTWHSDRWSRFGRFIHYVVSLSVA